MRGVIIGRRRYIRECAEKGTLYTVVYVLLTMGGI
jgi:hypothetical protein